MSWSLNITGTKASVLDYLHKHKQSIANPSEQAIYEAAKALAILQMESQSVAPVPGGALPLFTVDAAGYWSNGIYQGNGPKVEVRWVTLDAGIAGVSQEAYAAAQEAAKEAQTAAAEAQTDLAAAKAAQAAAEAKADELAAKLAQAEAATANAPAGA